ncbi:MAG TPA: rhomboid family intramembrane serine protease [Candidatus Limnocylindrales bacterium]|nr:rhomboid family intramembrane serine protease [Candidatus Limnocylindrales bacterium]
MVLPVHDVNPVRRTPIVTYALIAVNIVVFLLSPAYMLIGVESNVSTAELCQQQAFFDHYGAIPQEMLENKQLPAVPTGQVGQSEGVEGCVVAPPTYEKNIFVSVLSSMFLHAGWLHLLGNMLFLWVFGNNVEDRFGRLRYLLFYLATGYVAAYGFAAADPSLAQPLIGASGAVSGVLGAYLILYPRARVWSLVPFLLFLPLKLPAWFVLGLWFVLQWFYSSGYAVTDAGEVAFLAHVIGFLFGAVIASFVRALGPPIPPLPDRRRPARRAY